MRKTVIFVGFATSLLQCAQAGVVHTWTSPLMAPSASVQATYPLASLNEISGIASSEENRGVVWAVEDRGNLDTEGRPHVYAFGKGGCIVADFAIDGVEVTEVGPDPEAVAIDYRQGDGDDLLVIGDIGDNFLARSVVSLYVVPEPTGLVWDGCETATGTLAPTRYAFTYHAKDGVTPLGPRDAESMFVDPATGFVWLIAKESVDMNGDGVAAEARVFRIQTLDPVGTSVAAEQTWVFNESTRTSSREKITDAAISFRGDYVLARNYHEGWLWFRATPVLKSMFDGHRGGNSTPTTDGATGEWNTVYLTPAQLDLTPSKKEEAITFRYPVGAEQWDGFYTMPEYESDPVEAQLFRVSCAPDARCPPLQSESSRLRG